MHPTGSQSPGLVTLTLLLQGQVACRALRIADEQIGQLFANPWVFTPNR